MERTNIRHVDPNIFEEKIDFITIDVSFISLDLVIPVVKEIISKNNNKSEVVALIKPQFEADKKDVETGGVIKNKETHYKVLEKIIDLLKEHNLTLTGLTYSPIQGAEGNIEYLAYFKKGNNSFKFDYKKVIEDAFNNFA